MNCKQNEPLPPSPTLVATERMSSRSKGNTAEQAAKEQAGQVDVSPGKLALLASLEDEPAKAEVTPQEVAEGGNGIAVPPADPVQNLVSNVLQNAVVESAPAAPAAAPRSLQKTESWLVRDSDTARKKIEDALKMQSVGFDGAGNKNVQRSPNGVPQSWNLQSLDPRRAASNQATMDKIAEILHEHPELHCDCHGRTDNEAMCTEVVHEQHNVHVVAATAPSHTMVRASRHTPATGRAHTHTHTHRHVRSVADAQHDCYCQENDHVPI